MIQSFKPITLVFAILLLLAFRTGYGYPELPAFNNPSKDQQFQGKLIWMDLVTDDVEKATAFYSSLLGWESEVLTWQDKTYALLKKDGVAIAGVHFRPSAEAAQNHGIWIPYISVADLDETKKLANEEGGQLLLDGTLFNRGKQAIYRDDQGTFIGFMESMTGDPDDDAAELNEFNWLQLWTWDVDKALGFYQKVIGYESEADDTQTKIYGYHLISEGNLRASIMQLPESYKGGPSWLSFVSVENISTTVNKVKELGGDLLVEPQEELLGGRIAIIRDVMGAAIVVIEPKPKEEK
ncbi:MAG: VOC family protein [Opitutaceae bacterium]|nr:VOC family protein [Opitutaceae bacterium]